MFLILKAFEYSTKIDAGLTIGYNTFFTFYWMLTLFHIIHVIEGLVILASVYFGINKRNTTSMSGVRLIFTSSTGEVLLNFMVSRNPFDRPVRTQQASLPPVPYQPQVRRSSFSGDDEISDWGSLPSVLLPW